MKPRIKHTKRGKKFSTQKTKNDNSLKSPLSELAYQAPAFSKLINSTPKEVVFM
jgi:hypothetical protein